MVKDFVAFLTKTNALALAIGVIIGAATGKVVSALVDDLIMPLVGLIMPKGDWREAQIMLNSTTDAAGHVTGCAIKYGHLIGSFIDFVIIAFVVYMITKGLLPKEPPPPATKACPECLENLPVAARKCKACGSAV
ncbi:MAG: large conductance mechanosensitive channel protein MscL [Candidatus Obscuribacterales bacterium]|jgi:large conductance mechanosensitive channel|nr:large conductance mechanosensitive channel protein MscL [Candidatus Obscuribacterales bacterium]